MTTINDRPLLFKPKRQSLGHSPTRQKPAPDDILTQLTPATAVEALMSPTGPIRGCMALASPAEREFAMRTAIASQRIHEWLTELQDWEWPSDGGSTGFESCQSVRRKLFGVADPDTTGDQVGALTSEQVARFASRIEEIYHGMEQLGVDDIKSHILAGHIVPLARSSAPLTEGGRYNAGPGTYNKMDDLSAVVTAIVVQTLPNLARLSRLLQVWTMRITVLQHSDAVLAAIGDAESNMQQAWQAVSQLTEATTQRNDKGQDAQQGLLTRETFALLKRSLMRKVSRPGRTLDYMLDCLEGMDDTLPDDWLDRMEAVEHDYSNWAATAERRIREAEWLDSLQAKDKQETETVSKVLDTANGPAEPEADMTADASVLLPQKDLATTLATQEPAAPLDANALGLSVASDNNIPLTPPDEEPEVMETPAKPSVRWSASEEAPFDGPMSPVKEEVEEEEELRLPPMRGSTGSDLGLEDDSVLHGASSHFDGMSSDPPEVSASPAIKGRVREAEYFDDSPPSSPPLSPPLLEPSREASVTLVDSPNVSSMPEFDDSIDVKTPLDGSFMDDYDDSYSVPDINPPTTRRDSVGDQKLRKQISQIIQSIPAKIQLQSEQPTINLNPPDLQLPRLKKKSSKDQVKRSTSSMSSRTVTPSFTLSPAKNSRPRHQRGQQEIKVYHLSRSTGEAPIKLFIRCVGENGERVMVRVGGGWADLSEYLKEYASHHGRRSGRAEDTTVEVKDLPQVGRVTASSSANNNASSPASRPGSQLGDNSPMTPINIRKARRSQGSVGSEAPKFRPKTPATSARNLDDAPNSDSSVRSRPGSRLSWVEDDSSFLGLAGPSGKKVEMSEENKAWVESVKEKVRLASGERKVSGPVAGASASATLSTSASAASAVSASTGDDKNRFGDLGRVGGTKRLFRKSEVLGKR